MAAEIGRRRFLLAGCLLLATTACSGWGQPAGAAAGGPGADLAGLQQMISRGHAAEALEALDKLRAKTPVAAGVDRLRGVALYSENKLAAAEKAFGEALARDASDREAAQMRGITLFRLGRPAAAIPLLEMARGAGGRVGGAAPGASKDGEARGGSAGNGGSGAPVDPEYVLALCYLDTRRYDDARHAFAVQYGFSGDSAPAYLLAARMLLRREYLPVAQQFARKALELSPGLPLAHRLLGETELAGNHLEEAIREFELERGLNPLDAVTYDRLGDAYVRRGDLGDARRALQEAILLEPNATGPFILLGKVLLKQGDAAGAAGYLEHAREMDTGNYMTHSLLGQALRQMGRVEDARRETETAQKLQDSSAPKLADAP